MKIYENDKFFWIRKPNGVASTFGKQDNLVQNLINQRQKSQIISHLYNIYQNIYINESQNELGLINRLDNGTGGVLVFAKDIDIYQQARNHNIEYTKEYIAHIYGKFEHKELIIKDPIGHHISDISMMTTDTKMSKKMIDCWTKIEWIDYIEETDISIIKIYIKKGIRHQIRCHLASTGYYIVGENIYTSKGFRKKLHNSTIWKNEVFGKYIYNEDWWIGGTNGKYKIIEDNEILISKNQIDSSFYHLRSIGFE